MEEILDNQQELRGIVDDVVYKNKDTGYGVLTVDCDGEPITVVGDLAHINEGEEILAYGEYVNHPTYGRQFKAKACEQTLPNTAAGIRRYLSSGSIEGVGPATAKKLVAMFGGNTLEVMAKEPEKLIEVKGISKTKAYEISEQLSRIFGLRETVARMAELGIGTGDALQLFKVYASDTAAIVEDNPYVVCGYPLYKPFEFADSIAAAFGFDGADNRRIRAGIVNSLRHNMNNGHTCLPTGRLIDITSQFLECDRDCVEIELYDAVEEGFFGHVAVPEPERTALGDLFFAESYIADRLKMLCAGKFRDLADADKDIDAFQRDNGIVYEELQREAIAQALTAGVTVITGGPGTGKTTAIKAILDLCEQRGEKVALCAPTGRAAKRMSELTGKEARTIHRMLEVDFTSHETLKFVHDEEKPLKYDVMIVDEMSMVDSTLFASLLKGLKLWCRLVLVGDSNQLPSVGAGNVLGDIVKSGICPVIELEKIFRQAARSLIVVNAHAIVDGYAPDLERRDKDFFFLNVDKENVPSYVADLVARRLPKSYSFDPLDDIQVLSPSRIGLSGTETLNLALREKLNPPSKDKPELKMQGILLREGDKVMHVKNNYDIKWTKDDGENGVGMFNGDIGRVISIDRRTDVVCVRFDDRTAVYTFEQARLLEPAYAVTVHKSQGCEFPAVILTVADTPKRLCYRNLLYTAVTRAKDLLIIVGKEEVIAAMVENDRKMLRYTALCDLLQQKEETANSDM